MLGMRILYGVLGHGRGHATRALAVLPHLVNRHEVLVVAGGDAYHTLASAGYAVRAVRSFTYAYGSRGERSLLTSIARNGSTLFQVAFGGPAMRSLLDDVRGFGPDAAICDAEPWTHAAARRLGIPRISFDHFGVLTYCRPAIAPEDRLRILRDTAGYRLMVGKPEQVIVSSFFDAPAEPGVRVVGPLLRDEVCALSPERGGFLLAYLNRGEHQLVPHVEAALRAARVPVIVYGTARKGTDGTLEFRPPSNETFLRDLASSRAVFSTAGNQLVGEALYLGKPMLVMPEHTPEQRVNALALERMGAGQKVRFSEISGQILRSFLAREDEYRERIPKHVRDGRKDALAALEGAISSLGRRPARAPAFPSWRVA
jgi:uncharacterized protein (TIGR00661 family)